MKNIEIELRFTLNDDTALREWLKREACFTGVERQKDVYFQSRSFPFIMIDDKMNKDATQWLRIRSTDRSNILSYKRWHTTIEEKLPLYADEIEVKFDNPDNMKLIFDSLDFEPIATVIKQRAHWTYLEYLIVRDRVEDLGEFYEIEFQGKVDDMGKGIKK